MGKGPRNGTECKSIVAQFYFTIPIDIHVLRGGILFIYEKCLPEKSLDSIDFGFSYIRVDIFSALTKDLIQCFAAARLRKLMKDKAVLS